MLCSAFYFYLANCCVRLESYSTFLSDLDAFVSKELIVLLFSLRAYLKSSAYAASLCF